MSSEGNVDNESSAIQESGTKVGGASEDGHSDTSALDRTKHLVVDVSSETLKGHQRTASGHLIDTAAPIESVRQAVSKFGGVTDWKSQKAASEESCRILDGKLDKVEMELHKFKKRAEAAMEAKEKTQNELDSTKRLIEELKLNLERMQTEEQQAKQDSELAKLRVEEVQQGIGIEASVASNTEFEVAQARHAAAVAELKSVNDELEKLRGDYASLIVEKDLAAKRAEEAVSASMEVEKTVEALTLELIEVKGALESAHAAHLEAEELRVRADMDGGQDSSDLEKELKVAEEELEELNQKHQSEKEIKSKLDHATNLLLNLKAELEGYKDGGSNKDENESVPQEQISSNGELHEVRAKIDQATAEINCLKAASTSIESELEREKTELSTIKEKEDKNSETIASLEADLNKIMSELESIHKEKAAKENAAEEQNKINLAMAHAEMSKAKEEGEVLKAGVLAIEKRLVAVQMEMEASRASEKLALAAMKSLEESELVGQNSDESNSKGVTLSPEEYQTLSKRAQEVEEQAKLKVAAAVSQIEEAKQSEQTSLERLEELNKEKATKQNELKNAIENADRVEEEKLEMEQEVRKYRTENERRVASDIPLGASSLDDESPDDSPDHTKPLERSVTEPVETMLMNDMETDSSSESETLKKKKKKRSLFPRIVMYLARRKVQGSKPA